MLYTIFAIFLLSPLALLVGSLTRTAQQVRRGDVNAEAPVTVTNRMAKPGMPAPTKAMQTPAAPVAAAPAQAKSAFARPALGGRTRPALPGGNRRDFFGDRLVTQSGGSRFAQDEGNVMAFASSRGEAQLSRTA